MLRRTFLRIAGTGFIISLMPFGVSAQNITPAIPILMFHKVDDTPSDPESISSLQLAELLANIWNVGFYPVNISDILDGKIDQIVPKGLKPVGITADDSHRSIIFSKTSFSHKNQRNAQSFVDILRDSLKHFGRSPRATFFVAKVEDDRLSKQPEGYFGNYMPLPAVIDMLKAMPGLEIGYHTVRHTRMLNMNANQVKEIMEEQINDFRSLGIMNRVTPILAYPYGARPSPQGIDQLSRMGFKGAVLAYPGVHEATYDSVPSCDYNEKLLTNPFLIPRVCIGAHIYAQGNSPKSGNFVSIAPWEDFSKDILEALPNIYVSKGN